MSLSILHLMLEKETNPRKQLTFNTTLLLTSVNQKVILFVFNFASQSAEGTWVAWKVKNFQKRKGFLLQLSSSVKVVKCKGQILSMLKGKYYDVEKKETTLCYCVRIEWWGQECERNACEFHPDCDQNDAKIFTYRFMTPFWAEI